ncbi:MAG: family 20 glycosylhydrolase [Peptostreptococcaceae bacterium]|nr:family 20 glycosylhydrolase [Peptostreptococcaceae bacterium]
MKKTLFPLFMLAITTINAQNKPIQLIPQPVEVKQTEGFYEVTNSTTITYDKRDAQFSAEMLAQKLNTPTGFTLKAIQGKTGMIQLRINDKPDQQIGKEGYLLEVSAKGIVITANQTAGLYYGVQTLLQLLPKEIESKSITKASWTIPNVKITDYPRFAWRGIMLDVSRNFFTKKEVETYIDQISRLKYNVLHWHLTDDNGWRIEIKSLPKLTEVGAWRVERSGHFGERIAQKPGEKATCGGFYTQNDIKEIVKYAQERNITIVPEVDVPGHCMAAIASYPELCCTKDTSIKVNPGTNFSEWYNDGTFKMLIDNTLNPSDEKVYEFLDKVFTEVAQLFPGEYIHAGGDECYHGYWTADPNCQVLMKKLNITKGEELQNYFTGRVEKIIQSKGKKLAGWEEIMGGGISKDDVLMSWKGVEAGTAAAKKGYNVVMTPSTYAYLDYCQGESTIEPLMYAGLRVSKCYSYEPVPEGVDAKYILGGQGNLWTEQVPTFRYAEYMTYPRAWALSEVFWSPKEAKNWNNFAKRMENQFERSDVAEVNYSRAVYDAVINTSLKDGRLILKMSCEVPDVDIFFTIDDTMPDNFSTKYTGPVELPEGPITLRVITYRNGKPMGHLIILDREKLTKRAQ